MPILPDKEAFNKLYTDIEAGTHGPLTLLDIRSIFGNDFWMLLLYSISHINMTAENIKIEVGEIGDHKF